MVLLVFAVVYLGMFLGELPRLQIDRTGIALLGAITLLVTGSLSPAEAMAHLDVPTLALLFGMMVLSAQLRAGGVYRTLTRKVGEAALRPPVLLGLVVGLAGALSAVFTNDIVALAVAPVLIDICRNRKLAPVPFLLSLALACNVGSAATLVGNPQNILIGQTMGLSFAGYLGRAILPSLLGLAAVWGVVAWRYRGRWVETGPWTEPEADVPVSFRAWPAAKGLGLATLAMVAFLFTPWPRELVALACAGVVLTSRRFHSRSTLALVDWQLLVLFVGLFVVNGALADTGLVGRSLEGLRGFGLDPGSPVWLFGLGVTLSNLVSNVPAVMLLLPAAQGPGAGAILALSSTLAGNLLVVGSIANIIVVDLARARGIPIDWRTHAAVGIPVTLLTLALAGLLLWAIP